MTTPDKDKRKTLTLGQVSNWDNIQSDRFTLWANHYLAKKGLAIKDLSDFSDGVLLLNLLEIVSGKNVPRFIKNPRFLQQKIENITIALGFIEKILEIKVFGCNAKDIVDGNLKQILGIIFMLIQKSKETGDEAAYAANATPTKANQPTETPTQPSPTKVPESSTAKSAPTTPSSVISETPEEPAAAPVTTAIPITQETAPFTPKVHRPRVGTIEMLNAMGPSPKTSFIAKQEFFARKEQENREKQQSLQTRPHSMIAPKSEFGVPVVLLGRAGKDEGMEESPRSDAVSVSSDAVSESPRSDPSTPRSPPKPSAVEPATKEAEIEQKEAEQKASEPETASREPESEPAQPAEPAETKWEHAKPTEKPEPAVAHEDTGAQEAEKAKDDEMTPEQVKRAEKQKKKDLKKEKKRLSDLRRKEKRKSGTEGDFVEKGDSTTDLHKAAEGEEKGEKVEKGEEITIPVEVAVLVQTLIRSALARVEYRFELEEIERRKKELLDEISKNPAALRGTLRVQAVFRGRVTRIRVRREAQVYRRNEIAKEILSTERKYVQNLDVLVELFLEPLKKMLTPQQIRQIFSNVEVIRGYNKTLLVRLEDRMQVWYSKGQCLGDIFVEVTEFLKVYTTYVNNYNTSIATMTECMENPKFSAFIEKMRSASECNGLSFASFLIQPIQRLPRYVLLLQDLLKYTQPKHADYAQLSKALQKMKDVADYVNERKREAENLTQVLAIQAKLTGKFENLAEPHRRYVRRGILAMFDEKGMKSFFFFLFNDILVYTDYKSQSRLFRGSFGRQNQASWDEQAFNNGKFKFVGNLPLQGLGAGVADVPDAEKDRVQFAFQLITPTTSTLLMANSQDEKVAWMNDLDECLYALLEKERSRKISQLTDDPQSSWHTKVTVSTALEDGDYTGYIYKKANNNSWNQRYFLLRKGMLYYFHEKPPADTKEYPARVISLVWCSVKVGQVLDRGAVFQLATPARIIFLSSPDLRTMFQWIYVIRLAIAGQIQLLGDQDEDQSTQNTSGAGEGLTINTERFEPAIEPPSSPSLSHHHSLHNTSSSSSLSGSYYSSAPASPIIGSTNSNHGSASNTPTHNTQANTSMQDFQELLQQPENQVCADCGAPCPSWISTNHGVFLCVSCSGIHRRLNSGAGGLHSVRSLATRPESVDLRALGNALANAKYEKNFPPEMKPGQNDPYDKKVEWIKAKYSQGDHSEPIMMSTPPLSRTSSRESTPAGDISSNSLLGSTPPSSAEGKLQQKTERRNSALSLDKALNKTKEGHLYKRQGALLQDDWKLYRFILKEDHITYFKNKQPKGTIDLMLCSVKESEVIASGSERPKYSFELIAPTRIYMLAAESPQSRDEWVHAINVCIATMMK